MILQVIESLISTACTIFFDVYSNFVIEERHGSANPAAASSGSDHRHSLPLLHVHSVSCCSSSVRAMCLPAASTNSRSESLPGTRSKVDMGDTNGRVDMGVFHPCSKPHRLRCVGQGSWLTNSSGW